MKVSIIIPNYNGAALLEACLESISKQSYTTYDVVVIDNGSTDKSSEVLAKFSDWVRVIKFKKNVGFSKAVNRGIKACNGELVFVLNNDTILLPNCLASIVEGAKNNPDYASFAPSIRDIADINQIHSAGLMFSNRGFGNRSNRHEFLKVDHPIDVFGPCGAGAVYRRKVLEKVGLFNEDFFFYHEDIELSFRLQLSGNKCLYLPSAVLYHYGAATTRFFFRKKIKEVVKNSLITLIVCMPNSFFREYAWNILKFYAAFWRHLAYKGYMKELSFGLMCVGIKFIPSLIKRKKVQGQTVVELNYLRNLLYTDEIEINLPDEVFRL